MPAKETTLIDGVAVFARHTTRARVAQLLRTRDLTVPEIAAEVGKSIRAVNMAVRHLQDAGERVVVVGWAHTGNIYGDHARVLSMRPGAKPKAKPKRDRTSCEAERRKDPEVLMDELMVKRLARIQVRRDPAVIALFGPTGLAVSPDLLEQPDDTACELKVGC